MRRILSSLLGCSELCSPIGLAYELSVIMARGYFYDCATDEGSCSQLASVSSPIKSHLSVIVRLFFDIRAAVSVLPWSGASPSRDN